MSEKWKRTLSSKKFWCAMWCAGMAAFIVIANRIDFLPVAKICSVGVVAYGGFNVWQKKIDAEKSACKCVENK